MLKIHNSSMDSSSDIKTDEDKRDRGYLLIQFPLQLHDLVLHAEVELLKVLDRSGFNLEFLELSTGQHPAHATLQVHHSPLDATETPAGQEATHPALDQ